jgi:RNA recognition motif-containing protein
MDQPVTQDGKSVIVTNISPSANEKTVSDFFSFCGKINKLYLKREEGKDTSSAVIQFETESAAKTALLLTNALIVDRPITVTQLESTPQTTEGTTQIPVPDFGAPVESAKITQRDFGNVTDEQRSKTSVIASLLAAGYQLGNDALDKAKSFDDKHSLSQRAQHAVDQLKVKAHEIDVQYGISTKANAVKTSIEETAKKIDNELHITERASHAAQTIKQTAQSGLQKAQENPTVKKGIENVKNTAQKVSQSVTTTYNEVKQQTTKAIEEKQKEKRERAMSGGSETQTTQTTETTQSTTETNTQPAPQ